MRPGTPTDTQTDLRSVHLHLFLPPDWSGETSYEYVADDGISYGYRNGERSRIKVDVVSVDGNLAISTQLVADGYGPIEASFVIHGEAKSVRLNGSVAEPAPAKVTLTGKPLDVQVI
jgi:hypothetical protein